MGLCGIGALRYCCKLESREREARQSGPLMGRLGFRVVRVAESRLAPPAPLTAALRRHPFAIGRPLPGAAFLVSRTLRAREASED
jgi:hypothetical protein